MATRTLSNSVVRPLRRNHAGIFGTHLTETATSNMGRVEERNIARHPCEGRTTKARPAFARQRHLQKYCTCGDRSAYSNDYQEPEEEQDRIRLCRRTEKRSERGNVCRHNKWSSSPVRIGKSSPEKIPEQHAQSYGSR